MLYTGARESKADTERGRHGEKTKVRHGGGWVLEKERNCYVIQGKGSLRKCFKDPGSGVNASIASKWTDRQTESSIKSLNQSREETDETVWEQYVGAIGLTDL